MSVYILEEYVTHEGSTLLGVYATEEAAFHAAAVKLRAGDSLWGVSFIVTECQVIGGE